MSEPSIRLIAFLVLLFVFTAAETLWPRRARVFGRGQRWTTNLGFGVLGTIAVRLLGPLTAVATAIWAQHNGWGALNFTSLPAWMSFGLALLILDLSIYGQHWATHRIPLLWRLHKVHHTDRDIDVTTALRFHPIEIALSMVYKCGIVLALGPSVEAVILFEILLNGTAMFNHANWKLPMPIDRLLRIIIVTPDMHRVHHSIEPDETHSNFGFSLSVWDRLFGTYKAQPKAGHEAMTIGLPDYQSEKPSRIGWALGLPFQKRPD